MLTSAVAQEGKIDISTAATRSRVVLPTSKAGKVNPPVAVLTRLDFGLMALVTLVAAFFRLYQIDTIPPGLHYDEAFVGIIAKDLLEAPRIVIFFPGNFGAEPLSVYMVAGLYLIFGISATTVRLMPAIAGILTVPALYLLVRELFPEGPWRVAGQLSQAAASRVLALLSALALATLYWHITFSRYGVESNLLPLFEVLSFYFLWRGFRTRRPSFFVASGLLLGLSLYTYQAARMLPFLVALFVAYRLVLERRRFIEAYWKGVAPMGIAAFIAFAPLGYYFLSHPGSLTLRTGQVVVLNRGQSETDMVLANASKAAAMFLGRGDEDPRSNLPGRPVVDPILAIPFLLGAAMAVPRLVRPQYGFLAIWFIVMMMPTVLSEYAPHFRRTLGAIPVVAVVEALGLAGMLSAGFWLADRLRGRISAALRWTAALAVVTAVAASAALTYRDYFLIWGRSNDLFSAFDVGIMEAVRYANGLPANAEVFISPVPRSHLTVEFSAMRERRLKSFDGRRGFVLPTKPDVEAVYIVVTNEDNRSLSLLQRYFPQGRPAREQKFWDGRPYFTSFVVPARSTRATGPGYPLTANLANRVAFLGYDTPRLNYKPGDVIPLVLHWQGLAEMKESYTVFTHLLGPWDDKNKTAVWGQQDGLPLGGSHTTDEWDHDDVVLDDHAIPIRTDAPPGEYEIEVGMYLLKTMQRLPVIDPATGKQLDDRIVLGKVRVE